MQTEPRCFVIYELPPTEKGETMIPRVWSFADTLEQAQILLKEKLALLKDPQVVWTHDTTRCVVSHTLVAQSLGTQEAQLSVAEEVKAVAAAPTGVWSWWRSTPVVAATAPAPVPVVPALNTGVKVSVFGIVRVNCSAELEDEFVAVGPHLLSSVAAEADATAFDDDGNEPGSSRKKRRRDVSEEATAAKAKAEAEANEVIGSLSSDAPVMVSVVDNAEIKTTDDNITAPLPPAGEVDLYGKLRLSALAGATSLVGGVWSKRLQQRRETQRDHVAGLDRICQTIPKAVQILKEKWVVRRNQSQGAPLPVARRLAGMQLRGGAPLATDVSQKQPVGPVVTPVALKRATAPQPPPTASAASVIMSPVNKRSTLDYLFSAESQAAIGRALRSLLPPANSTTSSSSDDDDDEKYDDKAETFDSEESNNDDDDENEEVVTSVTSAVVQNRRQRQQEAEHLRLVAMLCI